MDKAIYKIGRKQYLLSSLKGYSKAKFLREGHGSEEHYEELKEWINPKKKEKESA